jgi:hypothetical protein
VCGSATDIAASAKRARTSGEWWTRGHERERSALGGRDEGAWVGAEDAGACSRGRCSNFVVEVEGWCSGGSEGVKEMRWS